MRNSPVAVLLPAAGGNSKWQQHQQQVAAAGSRRQAAGSRRQAASSRQQNASCYMDSLFQVPVELKLGAATRAATIAADPL